MAHGELTSRPLRSRVRLRRPVEGDHQPIASLVDEWWGGRRIRASLPRLWFRHFAGTSWIAEDDSGGMAGFLVGFVSPDRPDEAHVHLVGVDPNLRRRGIGTELVEAFAKDVAARGARRVTVIVPPDDRVALDFLRALAFHALDGPGTVRLYGSPSFPDYEGEQQDRAVLVRER